MNVTNLCIIILILACISILIYLLYRIKKDGLRATVVDLIVYAEDTFGSGEGQKKMDYVIDCFTEMLPAPLRLFVTANAIKSFAQEVFDQIKVALDYKPTDKQEQ